uniref:nitrate reductase (NADH) n=1 Tax=Cajanus cajan TaxID=3821 RepID=A0A151QMI1_CAJCA|nr:Nitrate reductase [NADH] 2 [Cajanus cajan]
MDPRDEGTADQWIARNASMVRLTGKHPFNSEPPLTRLMHHGFITPVPLHYVRNHGPVPKARWEDWTVEITGLVKRPTRFTVDRLVHDFPSREFPATLVCAGNRRKEQNMVKQSGALHVCFEGAEDLPGGGGSKYGTSVTREVAMDPSRDIILAYMQNGEPLAPDHGFPIRMIIPGFIGGRMVKWLKRIVVTQVESENHYHYKDNRVLPSHVDAELATDEGWWYKPEYIINELNINSVITTPCHEEILPINQWTTQRPYVLRGYAYSGGGRKVTRVEVTLDGGETWHVCALDRPEKPNKYGKYWCWCFWSLEVEVLDLLGTKEIAVRAWDEGLNTQPENLIWNVMGMMNNCWFRVKTNVCKPHKGEIGLVFEHPTQPGNQPGGWMAKERHLEKSQEPKPTLKKSVSTPFMNTASKMFSISEVKKHSNPDSAWIIVHGHVYDCSRFLKDHPGGTDSILINAGSDCTEEFDAIHSDKAKKMLEDYRIGELITTGYTSDSSPNSSVHGNSEFTFLAPIKEAPQRSVALNPREKIPCKLVSKTVISDDVRLFRLALPSEEQVLVAQAILKDPEDRTQMHVVYANRTEDDILLREELDAWAREHCDSFKLCVGLITETIMREHLPQPSGEEETLALTCGPPPMIQFAVQPNLEKMGYDVNNDLLVF